MTPHLIFPRKSPISIVTAVPHLAVIATTAMLRIQVAIEIAWTRQQGFAAGPGAFATRLLENIWDGYGTNLLLGPCEWSYRAIIERGAGEVFVFGARLESFETGKVVDGSRRCLLWGRIKLAAHKLMAIQNTVTDVITTPVA
jgi:hypothetical protein